MKESNFAKTYLPKWQAENPGGRLFRNNTGMAWQSVSVVSDIEGKRISHFFTFIKGFKALVLYGAKPIFYGIGLMKKSNKKGRKHPVGGGDYIGWTEKRICEIIDKTVFEIEDENGNYFCERYCDNCPLQKKVAIFTNIEFKTAGIPESPDQVKFRQLVEKSGGITKVIKEG